MSLAEKMHTAPLQDVRRKLEKFLPNLITATGMPGAAIAIRRGDETIRVVAGHTAMEGGSRISERSRFAVTCLGKLLTALCLLALEERGAISLDTPVSTILPELCAGDPQRKADHILLIHLLSHCSGYVGPGMENGLESWEGVVQHFAQTRQLFAPGSVFSEQNLDYVILGQVARTLTGKATEELIWEYVLRPLGINHSLPTAEEPQIVQGHRLAPDKDVLPMSFNTQSELWVPAITNLHLGIDDLARLTGALLGDEGGPFGARMMARLRGPVIELAKTVSARRDPEWLVSAFGLGYAHFGNGFGGVVSSGMGQCTAGIVHPESRIAIAIGLNAQSSMMRTTVLDHICRCLSGEVVDAMPGRRRREPPDNSFEDAFGGLPTRALSGRYEGCDSRIIKVRATAERVVLHLEQDRKIALGTLQRGALRIQTAFPVSVGFFRYDDKTPALRFGMKSYRKIGR